jgi:5,10-methylenetetrahydrofolate reductase
MGRIVYSGGKPYFVSLFLDTLRSGRLVVAAELRPPRAELASSDGMDAWIDTYHAVRTLTSRDTFVFLTDSAVGVPEEDNLRHLIVNLGDDAPLGRVVPFLTSKHPIDYCLSYADRARQHGFESLVVLGGDARVGVPRSVEHAWQLRRRIRAHGADLALGGWANPYRDPARQVDYLLDPDFTGEFFLTQVVSHHDPAPVERFLNEADRRGVEIPGVFGVFYFRSATPRTLALLRDFIPVPIDGLAREFGDMVPPEEICARTIRAMAGLGVRRFYVSNLPLTRTHETLAAILDCVGAANE